MSKTSDDASKYFRGSVAITVERKVIFDERIAKLGMTTVGDLVNLFALAPGIVEALIPFAEKHLEEKKAKKENTPYRKKLAEQLKNMTQEEMQKLLEQAGYSKW